MRISISTRAIVNRRGRTIAVVATLVRLLKAPILLMGIALPGENAHIPWSLDRKATS